MAFTWVFVAFVAFHFASSAFTVPLFSHPLHCQFRCGRWLFGFLAFWLFGFLAFWLFGFLAFWLFGFLAFWLFGFFAFWLFGFWRLSGFGFSHPDAFPVGFLHPQHRKFLSGPRATPLSIKMHAYLNHHFFDHHATATF